MSSRVVAILLILLVSLPATAQKDTTLAQPSWFMIIDGGLLLASRTIESAPSIRMRQGLRYDRFALSVGVGHDSYTHWHTLPLFTGVSFDFVHRSAHALYLQMDAGYSPAWFRRKELTDVDRRDAGGYFFHPTVGYRGGVARVQFHVSVGYKIQTIEWRTLHPEWNGRNWYEVTTLQQMQRLSFLIGIGLR